METESTSCSNCKILRAEIKEKDWEIEALRAQIEKLTRHDFLTGALNLRGIVETLQAELQRAHRTGHPFCFAVIDLDDFKVLSDANGISTGDFVLQTVSQASIKLLRQLDRFGRIENERFCVVLPATWPDQAVIAMDRLSKAIAACDPNLVAPTSAITFSGGLTSNALGDTPDRIIERAHEALAKAKEEGGARTILVEEAMPDMPIIDP